MDAARGTRDGKDLGLADVVRTHPLAIVGGILLENPSFVPPADFLRELHEQRSRSAGPASGA